LRCRQGGTNDKTLLVINRMNRKVPLKVYFRVAVGFFFCLLIVWYFTFRLLFGIILHISSPLLGAEISLGISFIICLLLIRRSIEKEMLDVDEPFSIVARDPSFQIQKEKYTIKIIFIRLFAAIIIFILASLPLTIIGILQIFGRKSNTFDLIVCFIDNHFFFYIVCIVASIFAVFVILPSLKKWNWTKHQF
jgi:hypothetical protein